MSTGQSTGQSTGFSAFDLQPALLRALETSGYTEPSPIQSAAIPVLAQGRDVLGLAQTGTGKTAAFALPILQQWRSEERRPQALVLTPTRELALQVAEAFKRYAQHMKGFKVAAIYGGQDMRTQLQTLRAGVHVVVGTPGRMMDHLRRGSLDTKGISTVVLDEADEMLRMGFIDDVQWILEQLPEQRQTALFSATMPDAIRHIAQRHLTNPEMIKVSGPNRTASQVEQYFCQIPRGCTKLEALTRILETSAMDAAIIFVRTRGSTVSLAEQLESCGYRATALNGDMNQAQREHSIQALKEGRLDVLVATDVAARGIDVSRITHVINFDVPHDQEAYVHRIGRTGRAGRAGQAILFITARERHLMRAIERATRQTLQALPVPDAEQVSRHRRQSFIERMAEDLGQIEDLDFFRQLVREICKRHQISPEEAAAVLASRLQQERPLKVANDRFQHDGGRDFEGKGRAKKSARFGKNGRDNNANGYAKGAGRNGHDEAADDSNGKPRGGRGKNNGRRSDVDLIRYRVEVGQDHEIRPGDLVGAIANETGIHPDYIGAIQIKQQHSFIEMPADMPRDLFQHLGKVWVRNRPLRISVADGGAGMAPPRRPRQQRQAERPGARGAKANGSNLNG